MTENWSCSPTSDKDAMTVRPARPITDDEATAASLTVVELCPDAALILEMLGLK